MINHNSNKLCDRITDHSHNSRSYREKNHSLYIWENFYKLWSAAKDLLNNDINLISAAIKHYVN